MLEDSTKNKIDSLVEGENKKLRQDHSGVTIIRRGKRLYLRATLPPKLRSSKTKPHQQYLALGVYANPSGIKTAAAEARKVSALVSLRQFNWEPYLRHQEVGDVITFGDLVNSFKEHFFSYAKAKHKEQRWQKIERTLKLFPLEVEFTMPALEKAALKIVESIEKPAARRNAKQEIVQFIHFIETEKNMTFNSILKKVNAYGDDYEPEPRDLPTDEMIQTTYFTIEDPAYRAMYGYQAAFGKRNHEIFKTNNQPLISGEEIIYVSDDTKTGFRVACALYSEWIEMGSMSPYRENKLLR